MFEVEQSRLRAKAVFFIQLFEFKQLFLEWRCSKSPPSFGYPDFSGFLVRKTERQTGSDVRLAAPLAALERLVAIGQVRGDALEQLVRRSAHASDRLPESQHEDQQQGGGMEGR